jgi:hypothetical protein
MLKTLPSSLISFCSAYLHSILSLFHTGPIQKSAISLTKEVPGIAKNGYTSDIKNMRQQMNNLVSLELNLR